MTLTALMMVALVEAISYFLIGFLIIKVIINLVEDFFK